MRNSRSGYRELSPDSINQSSTGVFEAEKADVYSKPNTFPLSEYKDVTGFGVGFAAVFGEVLISHPFVVFRRQCQVNSASQSLHLTPFTCFSIFSRITSSQGLTAFWKGLSSSFVVYGLVLGIENLVSELYRLPKEISAHSSLRRVAQHVILKTVAWSFVTPVYAAHMVECVQSEIASDSPGLFDCIKEASRRFWIPKNFFKNSQKLSSTLQGDFSKLKSNQEPKNAFTDVKKAISSRLPITTSRLLPYWTIVGPITFYTVGHYTIKAITSYFLRNYYRNNNSLLGRDDLYNSFYKSRVGDSSELYEGNIDGWNEVAREREETALQATYMGYYTELNVNLWASFLADMILYPLETIVVRLCVQGTRTLVDNLDNGESIVPVMTAYSGMGDIWQESLRSATGLLGLYRGFGALILQYSMHLGFLYGIRYIYEQILYNQSVQQQTIADQNLFSQRQPNHGIQNESNL
ncbi:hypothetical protein Ciccas_008059 [Cichlidogyrus casuarinus]|uniref:Solute carrier family 25 member 46 n=1 Tax=Cichlidogyrus casuarinus TaxID=1844966 RepID=A0ABD2Q124_9PLAT